VNPSHRAGRPGLAELDRLARSLGVQSWLHGPGAESDERWLNWLARVVDGLAVGHFSATVRGSSAWLAWIVAVESQRQGYGTEAARAVIDCLATNGIRMFAAAIPEGHEASEGVARKLGLLVTDELANCERVWRTQH
jgi:RimJ/RimL family protein N-acetyltransferase